MAGNAGKTIFVLGGTRSGKSSFALQKANLISGNKAYIATAEPLDHEMKDRIEKHRRQRGEDWITYEETLNIADLLKKTGGKYSAIVLDCLTIWLSNVTAAGLDAEAEIEHLAASLADHNSSLLYIVSNEVGMGIVPDNELARKFRDIAGLLNQKIAELADEVYLVTAGIPLKIK